MNKTNLFDGRVTLYSLGHGLTLVRDWDADCFENAWCVMEGVPEDYTHWDDFWRQSHSGLVMECDLRILAVLAERVTGVEVTL